MTGKVYLVGIGPGNPDDMTPRAINALKNANVVIGHKSCLDLIRNITAGKEIIGSDLSPVQRAEIAGQRALAGTTTAIVTTGDSGIYAIASTFFSWLKRERLELDVTVVPGLPAGNVAAALLGSPIGGDFATISLTDRASPWHGIKQRIKAAAESGFVIILYNPKGKVGGSRLREAIALLRKSLAPSVPVGIVTDIDGKTEQVIVTTLDKMLTCEIGVQSLIIIGNATTFVYDGKMVTPRNYIKDVGY